MSLSWGDVTVFQKNHLADILTFPVMMPILICFQQIVGVRGSEDHPTAKECCFWLVVWSFLFEFLFPIIIGRGTPDWIDVGCYAVGAGMFMLLHVSVSVDDGVGRIHNEVASDTGDVKPSDTCPAQA